MPADVVHQFDIAIRLIVAAVFGAAVGFEREIHEHPAGMRTHLMVALGSALSAFHPAWFLALVFHGLPPSPHPGLRSRLGLLRPPARVVP